MKKIKQPSMIEACLMLTLVIATIAISVIGFKIAPNIAILFAIGIVMIYMSVKRMPFDAIHDGII